MGKPRGFIEYLRELPLDRPALERIRDWNEFHLHLDESKLREQGARCMDCGIPFCHTGSLISGMASGCPINNLIPEWNDLIYRGLWRRRPSTVGCIARIMPRLHWAGLPGSVRRLLRARHHVAAGHDQEHRMRYQGDKGWDEGWVVAEPPAAPPRQVLPLGWFRPGGLLRAGGPVEPRRPLGHGMSADRVGGLPARHSQHETRQRIYSAGISSPRKVLPSPAKPRSAKICPRKNCLGDFDAVVICTGANAPRPAHRRPGVEGIHFAMEFLHANTKSLLDKHCNGELHLRQRQGTSVVIGGGDTGTDWVLLVLPQCHGCRSLVQLEILPQPPKYDRAKDILSPSGPRFTSSTPWPGGGCRKIWRGLPHLFDHRHGNLSAMTTAR